MASWAEFAAAEPTLARHVEERFAIRKHKTMATLRRDGSPRISGIELEFANGELFVGMMPGSVKLRDLERDPRLAIHSPTDDPPDGNPGGWRGEAKITGTAVDASEPPDAGGRRFRIDISEAVLTHLNEAGDQLVVESWRPGTAARRLERR
jgi:hypothetical protein